MLNPLLKSQGFGLDQQRYETFKDHALAVVMDGGRTVSIPWPDPNVPEFVGRVVEAVIAHQVS